MILILETVATALLDAGDELAVRRVQHALPERGFIRLWRLERIKECLVLARGVATTTQAQLLHQAGEAKARCRHANGTHQTGLVGVDLVSGTGDVVGTRSPQVGNDR